MQTSVIGFPRIGAARELKFASEKYFRGDASAAELEACAAELRARHISEQLAAGVDFVPCNDFSLYDAVLDTACLLNAVPARFRALDISPLERYFAMARGYQGAAGDAHALAMKKWFNTNYHYIVPEIDDEAEIRLAGEKPFAAFLEAEKLRKDAGFEACIKPVVLGPFTFLKLARFTGTKTAADFADDVSSAYVRILTRLEKEGAEWIQFDEPALVMDLTAFDKELFCTFYHKILAARGAVKALLQTYFGDIRDCYVEACGLGFDGIGLDFVEGRKTFDFVLNEPFPEGSCLFAGLVNGKNIWRNDYAKTLAALEKLKGVTKNVVLSTSCSLLHVPYTLKAEGKMDGEKKRYFAFAQEKLAELSEIKAIAAAASPKEEEAFKANRALFEAARPGAGTAAAERSSSISKEDFERSPGFFEREKLQKARFKLPILPTTTIGSFPQTADVKANRAAFRKGEISQEEYEAFNRKKIAECIAF